MLPITIKLNIHIVTKLFREQVTTSDPSERHLQSLDSVGDLELLCRVSYKHQASHQTIRH